MSFSKVYSLADPKDRSVNVNNGISNFPEGTDKIYSSGDSIETCSDLAKDINWSELPSPAVVCIYSFLSRADQSSMSQVCSRWAEDLNTPCLWKRVKFYLPENNFNSEIYPEVRFALMYGHMFTHVEIICNQVKTDLVDIIWKDLKHFLKTLATSSQLTSIKFIDMDEYLDHLYNLEHLEIFDDMFNDIISFFKSQRNLKKVVFRKSLFSMNWGMDLLKAILHSDCNNISSLKLRRFINSFLPPEWSDEYMDDLTEVCRKIVYVRSLEMDYTLVFEDIINKMYEMLFSGNYQLDEKQPCMSKIKVYCVDIVEEEIDNPENLMFRGIQPQTWKYLTTVLPDLKVKMYLTIWSRLSEMEKFLVRELPLSSLDFQFEETSATTDISDLISHLQACNYENRLEKLNILWFPPIADFVESIIPFVQFCHKLKILYLHVASMPNDIESILKELLEHHPKSLKSVTFRFNNHQKAEGDKNLESISEEYQLLFRLQGMEFFLVVERN